MSAFMEDALGYARYGWAVLPLSERSKVPAVSGGCNSASCDERQIARWWGSRPACNIGIATGAVSGLVVLDLDVDEQIGEDGLSTLSCWEKEHGELPETVTAITGRRGIHMYYRCDEDISCSVNKDLGVDIRGNGGFVVAPPSMHSNGNAYCWENDPEDFEVAYADEKVLAFIRYVQGEKRAGGRFELPESIGPGERNDVLFRYGSSLQAQGYDDAYILMVLESVNGDRCIPPLPKAEVRAIAESVTGRYRKGTMHSAAGSRRVRSGRVFHKLGRDGRPTGRILHNVVGAELIEEQHACNVDGVPAVWNGTRYLVGIDNIYREVVELVDDAKISDQREVYHYLRMKSPSVEGAPAKYIAFDNGVLDVLTGAIVDDPSLVIVNAIPHSYDPEAYCADADAFLDRISCGDGKVRMNLEEIIGLSMYRSNEFGQCPILLGSGSNGKSTYIQALRNVLGDENVSSLDIGMLGKPFLVGHLMGKLANLGDDISNERLNGDALGVFKKVATGDWVFTDVKNGVGFQFKPYALPVFSCNEFPSLGDSSDGVMRRLFPIPFEARFSRSDPDYDPRLLDKLRTEDAARYFIRVGVEGLRRAYDANGMTPNHKGERIVADVLNDNDSVLQWIAEFELDECDFDEKIISHCYQEYAGWCAETNMHPFAQGRFTRKINIRYGMASVPERREFVTGSRVVRVFRKR